jgi:hypothetical protein
LLVLLGAASGCSSDDFTPGGDGGPAGDGNYWPNVDGNINPSRPSCPGQEATISGKVLAPNGTDAVPGASVFIPEKVPEIFPPSVACEVCGTLGGSTNLWYTTSAYDGAFTLKQVCPGKRPLVFQNGRFRRFIYVEVPAKGQLQLPAADTRLPRRNQELNVVDAIPKIALATGDYDKMECELRKLGLEDNAFDRYEGAKVLTSKPALPSFGTLVNDLAKMKSYNIIFINCTTNTFEEELKKPQVRQNIKDYMNAGGRFYVTDWSYDWIEQVEAFSPFIDFEPGPWTAAPEKQDAAAMGVDGLKIQATVKDPAMAKWLALYGAVSGDKVQIEHFLIDWVIMNKVGKDVKLWVEGPVKSRNGAVNGVRPLTVTFNFQNCGKILYTSYHTEGRDDELQMFPLPVAKPYPQYCSGQASPQDRILEYLIFDIANCVKPIE